MKTPSGAEFKKDKGENSKQVSFVGTVTPITIQLQVDEIDDEDGNDTDLMIDEDIIQKKDVVMLQVELPDELPDEEDDIPLSQIKHGERMVKYWASRENESESDSDEFDTSTQEEREIAATLEVVTGIVEDILNMGIGCGDPENCDKGGDEAPGVNPVVVKEKGSVSVAGAGGEMSDGAVVQKAGVVALNAESAEAVPHPAHEKEMAEIATIEPGYVFTNLQIYEYL